MKRHADEVAGEFIRHTMRGFRYRYVCPCGDKHFSSAPTLSVPPLCHTCYSGQDRRRQADRKRRKA